MPGDVSQAFTQQSEHATRWGRKGWAAGAKVRQTRLVRCSKGGGVQSEKGGRVKGGSRGGLVGGGGKRGMGSTGAYS